jgi:hypothetical protein
VPIRLCKAPLSDNRHPGLLAESIRGSETWNLDLHPWQRCLKTGRGAKAVEIRNAVILAPRMFGCKSRSGGHDPHFIIQVPTIFSPTLESELFIDQQSDMRAGRDVQRDSSAKLRGLQDRIEHLRTLRTRQTLLSRTWRRVIQFQVITRFI